MWRCAQALVSFTARARGWGCASKATRLAMPIANTCGGHLKEDCLIGDANLGNELVAEFSSSFVDETLHFDVFAQGDEVLVQTFGEIQCFTVRQWGIDAYDHHKIVAGVVYESNARIVANEGAQADVGSVFGNGLDHVA